jgi:hypothetical protein
MSLQITSQSSPSPPNNLRDIWGYFLHQLTKAVYSQSKHNQVCYLRNRGQGLSLWTPVIYPCELLTRWRCHPVWKHALNWNEICLRESKVFDLCWWNFSTMIHNQVVYGCSFLRNLGQRLWTRDLSVICYLHGGRMPLTGTRFDLCSWDFASTWISNWGQTE